MPLIPSVEQADTRHAPARLAEQADITLGEASRRIERYASFNDLPLTDVSRAILDGSVRLLTIREEIILARRTAGSDGRADPG